MFVCEMCGKQVGKIMRIRVDRAVLLVGPECTRFGVPVDSGPRGAVPRGGPGAVAPSQPRAIARPQTRSQKSRETDPLESRGGELVLDYSKRIQRARNELGFNQEQLAAKLNEKRSVVRELETGTLIPNDALIRKLEKQLKITLTENVSGEYRLPTVKRKELTLGDLMKE